MDEFISKTQKKKEALALQELGNQLTQLDESTLKTLPLSERLFQAICDAKRITSHGAMRRQAQWIGKLMRSEDAELIAKVYTELLSESNTQTAKFHEIEQWRDRLIAEDKTAITEFINIYQPEDIQSLRQLVKKAIAEVEQNRHTGATKALFRFIRSTIS